MQADPIAAFVKDPIQPNADGSITIKTKDGRVYSCIVRDADSKQVNLERADCQEIVRLVLKILESKEIIKQAAQGLQSLNHTKIDGQGVHIDNPSVKANITHTTGQATTDLFKQISDIVVRYKPPDYPPPPPPDEPPPEEELQALPGPPPAPLLPPNPPPGPPPPEVDPLLGDDPQLP